MTTQPFTDTESSAVTEATIDVWLLTQRDCAFCEQAKNVLGRLSHEYRWLSPRSLLSPWRGERWRCSTV